MPDDRWTPVPGGWMQAPGPAGRYPGDAVAVVLETRDGDPVAMAELDVDWFGAIDDGLVPAELTDAELTAIWWG
jgi:hypothetical protein